MNNLITKTDIKEFWPMSLNMDNDRINPYIVRAEQNNLQSIMSPQLYNAFKTNFVRDYLNNAFENNIGLWSQYGTGTDVTWISNGLRGVSALLVNPTAVQTKVLYQQIYTKGLPFSVEVNFSAAQPNSVINVLGANKTDFSDATILANVINPPLGIATISVPAGLPYSYVGVNIINPLGGLVVLHTANLKMEDRWYKLWYGELYKYGSSYDQQYPGARQLLCAYAYAYIVDNNAIHITRGGVNKKIGEQTENATDKNIASKNQESYSEAIRLEGQFLQWISQRGNGPYKEWDGSKPAKNASVNFFNASRCSKYGF